MPRDRSAAARMLMVVLVGDGLLGVIRILAIRAGARGRPLLYRPESLTQFGAGEGQCCKKDGEQPEAGDDLCFGPAAEVEMVVNRGDTKNAFAACELEISHLHHHGQG